MTTNREHRTMRMLVAGLTSLLALAACTPAAAPPPAVQAPSSQAPTASPPASPAETQAASPATKAPIKPKPAAPKKLAAIVVTRPFSGAHVSSPVHIKGTADVFEARFRVRVLDSGGNVIADKVVTATSGTGTRGSFSADISYPTGHGGSGTLYLFEPSPKDGSPINVLTIRVTLR